jgi:WD40 repeat protein
MLGEHTGTINSVAFSPDGKKLVTGGADGARIWTLGWQDQSNKDPHSRNSIDAGKPEDLPQDLQQRLKELKERIQQLEQSDFPPHPPSGTDILVRPK